MVDEKVIVGHIGAPHGIKGWVKVNSHTKPRQNVLDYQPWLVEQQGQWRAMTVLDYRLQQKNIVVHLKNCDDRNAASHYTNAAIAINREQLPVLGKDEFYWVDLQGMTVINQEGVELGTVAYLFETGANDVLVVQGEQELLIPYVTPEVIVNVDRDKRCIHVNWVDDK